MHLQPQYDIYAANWNNKMDKVGGNQTKSVIFSARPMKHFKIDFQFLFHFMNTYLNMAHFGCVWGAVLFSEILL